MKDVLESIYKKTGCIIQWYVWFLGKNRSTSTAFIEVIDKITDAIHMNKFCVGVFIEFKKAFDTADYSLLL